MTWAKCTHCKTGQNVHIARHGHVHIASTCKMSTLQEWAKCTHCQDMGKMCTLQDMSCNMYTLQDIAKCSHCQDMVQYVHIVKTLQYAHIVHGQYAILQDMVNMHTCAKYGQMCAFCKTCACTHCNDMRKMYALQDMRKCVHFARHAQNVHIARHAQNAHIARMRKCTY